MPIRGTQNYLASKKTNGTDQCGVTSVAKATVARQLALLAYHRVNFAWGSGLNGVFTHNDAYLLLME